MRLLSHMHKPWNQLCAMGGTHTHVSMHICLHSHTPTHNIWAYVWHEQNWYAGSQHTQTQPSTHARCPTVPLPHAHTFIRSVSLPDRCEKDEQSWQSAASCLSAGANSLYCATSVSLSHRWSLSPSSPYEFSVGVFLYLSILFSLISITPFSLLSLLPSSVVSNGIASFVFSSRWRRLASGGWRVDCINVTQLFEAILTVFFFTCVGRSEV